MEGLGLSSATVALATPCLATPPPIETALLNQAVSSPLPLSPKAEAMPALAATGAGELALVEEEVTTPTPTTTHDFAAAEGLATLASAYCGISEPTPFLLSQLGNALAASSYSLLVFPKEEEEKMEPLPMAHGAGALEEEEEEEENEEEASDLSTILLVEEEEEEMDTPIPSFAASFRAKVAFVAAAVSDRVRKYVGLIKAGWQVIKAVAKEAKNFLVQCFSA